MNFLLAFVTSIAACAAAPGYLHGYHGDFLRDVHGYHAGLEHAGHFQLPLEPLKPVVPIIEQHHSQDITGRYGFNYVTPDSSRSEVSDFDGTKHGSYSYVSADGKLETVNYLADALGFRVAGTNLPVGPAAVTETPEVMAKRAEHLAAHEAAKSGKVIEVPEVTTGAPVTPVTDEAAVAEARTAHLAAVEKQAALTKAVATGDVSALDRTAELPVPVQDTPEVALAKADHLAHKNYVSTLGGFYPHGEVIPSAYAGYHGEFTPHFGYSAGYAGFAPEQSGWAGAYGPYSAIPHQKIIQHSLY